MNQKRYNQELKQIIIEFYRSGERVSQLASEYRVSEVVDFF